MVLPTMCSRFTLSSRPVHVLSVPTKHPGSDLVEINKIVHDHLAEGGKMALPELAKSYTDDFLTKIFQHFC